MQALWRRVDGRRQATWAARPSSGSGRRGALGGGSLDGRDEHVALAADGLDELPAAGSSCELAAESVHGYVDGAWCGFGRAVPCGAYEGGWFDDGAGGLCQRVEEGEFGPGEGDGDVGDRYALGRWVEAEAGNGDGFAGGQVRGAAGFFEDLRQAVGLGPASGAASGREEEAGREAEERLGSFEVRQRRQGGVLAENVDGAQGVGAGGDRGDDAGCEPALPGPGWGLCGAVGGAVGVWRGACPIIIISCSVSGKFSGIGNIGGTGSTNSSYPCTKGFEYAF